MRRVNWQTADLIHPPRAQARRRRLVRLAGTLMIVLGVGFVGWTVVVWQWQDPFTLLYTKYEQHQLAKRYEQRVERFTATRVARRAAAPVSRSEELRALAVEARRYRLASRRGEPLGRIRVPRLGVNMILVNGTDGETLKKGPGRDERTFMPGEGELVYIAGHRTTYGAPFARINEIRRGDEITLELPYATFVYRVTGHVIVPADDIGRLRSRGREEVALQACHPRFFATQRYIVYARPTRIEPRGRPPIVRRAAEAASTESPDPLRGLSTS